MGKLKLLVFSARKDGFIAKAPVFFITHSHPWQSGRISIPQSRWNPAVTRGTSGCNKQAVGNQSK